MLTSNLGNDRIRDERLFNYPRLEVLAELAPPTSPSNYLRPTNRRHLRLDFVNRQHKPISNSEIRTVDHHAAEIAPELTGHGLPLIKCEAYNRVYDQSYRSR